MARFGRHIPVMSVDGKTEIGVCWETFLGHWQAARPDLTMITGGEGWDGGIYVSREAAEAAVRRDDERRFGAR